jgi:hypothetical protein
MCTIIELTAVTPRSHFTATTKEQKTLPPTKVNFKIQKN